MAPPFWRPSIVAALSGLPWPHSSMLEDTALAGGGMLAGGPPATPNGSGGVEDEPPLPTLASSPASSLPPPPLILKNPALPLSPPHAWHTMAIKVAASALLANAGRFGVARQLMGRLSWKEVADSLEAQVKTLRWIVVHPKKTHFL